ncbi:deoxyribose-phosphate aldolase [Heliobacillus mobilis]|uniref:Deoxyribose-phosphate aldolase n=1 Tax=Heliobacterium mobile TaxID=28064 RepID=A0A6I3SME5_HELMO|nr:deoxyribose-phosphate aldolase [Heliobacterium mobile]MTV50153.1 deoxyribose-phosphate aldolase [Heliobacterium mobile]
MSSQWTKDQVARTIDHTLLKPDAVEAEIVSLCREAVANRFAAVCVNPIWVPTCAKHLKNESVKVATVIGFPLGANCTEIKAKEAQAALQAGAAELDMVLNVGWAKQGHWDKVQEDIATVVEEARQYPGAVVKVILETAFLSDDEIVEACHRSVQAGAEFVKTSTGFGPAGATVEHVALMGKAVGERAKVKASGGIRTAEKAAQMLSAGADRLGTSASIAILNGFA